MRPDELPGLGTPGLSQGRRLPLHEVEVTADLVRRLLREQHPDLASLPLRAVAAGWDNALFRLGDDLLVRLPLRQLAAPLVEHEQRWLPVLAPDMPLPIPVPVRAGRPGAGFPWRWSVLPWFDGTGAETTPVISRTAWAGSLAAALAALHRPAPAHAPVNPYRGVPLATRADVIGARLAASSDSGLLLTAWHAGLAAPAWDGPALWLHGDPHPGNLVVRDGALAAIVDFGDLTSGDPASDLATAWLTFDPAGRAAFRAALPYDEATWVRARAWAAALVPVLRAHPAELPLLDAAGRHATQQLRLDDPG